MQYMKTAQRVKWEAKVEEKVEDEGEKKVEVRKLPYNPENEMPHCAHPKGYKWTSKKGRLRRRYAKFQAKGAPTMQINDIKAPGS